MHYTVTLTRPPGTLSHLPAPRLRQAGRMGEGRGEGSVFKQKIASDDKKQGCSKVEPGG